jgi:hypothetical protein
VESVRRRENPGNVCVKGVCVGRDDSDLVGARFASESLFGPALQHGVAIMKRGLIIVKNCFDCKVGR